MNFLAHIFLSGEDHQIAIGNFIGDFVKGKEIDRYPEDIRLGIRLHRAIDHYTDQHPVVLESKKRLRPGFHHFAPVIVDVFYDHFLARTWSDYHHMPLKAFTLDFYSMIKENLQLLPSKAQHMYGYMSSQNWLYGYQYIEGIDKTLTGMSRRTSFKSGMEHASEELEKNYAQFEREFKEFFPQLQEMCHQYLNP
jgi:acyl carrier protein phosphodiesterase